MDFAELEKLLKSQFELFVRDQGYSDAMEWAINILNTMKSNQNLSNHDAFYLYLHEMILQIYEKLNNLGSKLENTRY
ncbi:MAG: hypothetical protein OEZ01_15245 [Candidatus Heimdallarchaeota archaeon]|nr:hypothetical protein [Candidatus Heimdallarchaeota archaeon]MDH5647364.1 hypothetical protein [Candidatus Heimdallarchaeota archaeon]